MTTPSSSDDSHEPPALSHDGTSKAPNQDSDGEQIKLTPWLVTLGIAALVIGLLTGVVMSQATLIR